MSTLYADLSHHDWDRAKGELDWSAIRAATSPVLCLRATYGDPKGYNPATRHFADMARGARSAGFDTIGGYHNLIRGDQASINRQVDYLRRTLDGVGAQWAMLDVERYPELVTNGLWPRFGDVRQFCDRWHVVDSRVLAVYLPRWIWSGHLGSPDLRVLHCPLVASDYGSNPDGSPSAVYRARGGDDGRGWTAYGGVTPAIWQYGSNTDCPGASGHTDANAFRGSLDELRALLTGDDDMQLSDQLQLPPWAPRTWPDDQGLQDGRITVQTALGSGYGHARAARDGINSIRQEQAAARLRDEAILKAVAGQNADTILAEIRAQAEQTRAALAGARSAILAALPAGDGPVSRDDLVAALTTVLGALDGATPQD